MHAMSGTSRGRTASVITGFWKTGDLARMESQREETIILRPPVEGRVVVEKVAAVAVSSVWSRHLGVRAVVRINCVLLG